MSVAAFEVLRSDVTATGNPVSSMSVVVSTYEWPEALDAVLRGLRSQSDDDFEVVVADDGSTVATTAVVHRWANAFGSRLLHVRQSDEGFRLARVRNLGAAAARGSHLVFIDGDCIPRRRFVESMRKGLIPGWFLGSKRLECSARLSRAVLRAGTPIERWSSAALLVRTRGEISGWKHLTPRDRRRPWRSGLPDFVPRGNEYGFCMGISRGDFDAVNGFDMRFLGWGEQDVDLATRLRRLGRRSGYAGPGSTLIHLWHPSRMADERETWYQLQETTRSDRIEAVEGIRELDGPDGHQSIS